MIPYFFFRPFHLSFLPMLQRHVLLSIRGTPVGLPRFRSMRWCREECTGRLLQWRAAECRNCSRVSVCGPSFLISLRFNMKFSRYDWYVRRDVGLWQTSFPMWDYSIPGQIMPFFPVKIWEMKMQTPVKQSLFCVCIFLFYCVPILYQKQPIPSRELRVKNTGIRKRATVTIVKEKVIALQQFFLQN